MDVALVGAELEENLGLRYMASALENKGHRAEIITFNSEYDSGQVVKEVTALDPQLTGFSMVFTGRAREFCRLANALRDGGYRGHLVAGGHFASFNCERLLQDFPAFDSVALGEGEELICDLADHLADPSAVPGLCYRGTGGATAINPCRGNPDNLDALAFPKRTTFHKYFDKPIASVLTSRGCWRDCAFCSINAWYKRSGGKKFRVRSVDNILSEVKDLYFRHGVRIFNFQDDNFFLPNPVKAARRFEQIRDALRRQGVGDIAIAVKARPDSITRESIAALDDLGLFRVFLGVENASENGLQHLNRKCDFEEILTSLRILNDFDVHLAFNILMFEPETVLDEILTNIRFIGRHIENPLNFCRAETYAGTGLEAKLRPQGRLLGDYFGYDYRIKDPSSEAFHQIANYAFFDRNFSDFGLHYFNMQVDFYFQLLRRFHPEVLSETLRASVRNFIKQTNLDTYECLSEIYDFVVATSPNDQHSIRNFALRMREWVDGRSRDLHSQGEQILASLDAAYEHRGHRNARIISSSAPAFPLAACKPVPYRGLDTLQELDLIQLQETSPAGIGPNISDLFGLPAPIPYDLFKRRMDGRMVDA